MATARACFLQFMQLTNRTIFASLMVLLASTRPGIAAADLNSTIRFDIEPQALHSAVVEYTEQSGVQITSAAELLKGQRSPGVVGEYPARVALTKLLAGTALAYDVVDANTVAIRSATVAQLPGGKLAPEESDVSLSRWKRLRHAQNSGGSVDGKGDAVSTTRSGEEGSRGTRESELNKGMPEILVKGSRVLNMDIARSRDDPQPYVIFERELIEKSGARNIEDFLKQRLTMNTQAGTFSQQPGIDLGNMSRINLRGLGTNQTLILVDGHRAMGSAGNAGLQQADINGIPLSAVERIEILPTTASGIYGGSATGGVVNIVLRRDYQGADLKVTYDNTFDSDSAQRRIDLSAGLTFEEGNSSIFIAGSYADASTLSVGDRNFVERGRAAIRANNAAFFAPPSNAPLGATVNIRSANGSPLFGPGTPNFTSVPAGYAGGGGRAPLQSNAGQYSFGSAPSAQTSGSRQGLLSAPTVESVLATLRRGFGSKVQAFLEVGASNNSSYFDMSGVSASNFTIQASAPNNPFGQAIVVTIPTSFGDGQTVSRNFDRRLIGGVIVKLPGEWRAEADHTWNRSRYSLNQVPTLAPQGVSAIGNGTLDVLRDLAAHPLDYTPFMNNPSFTSPFKSTLNDTTLRTTGPVFSVPGGPVIVSALLAHRDEEFGEGFLFSANPFFFPEKSQTVESAYVELRVPVVSQRNARPGLQELEMQLAGRRDEYHVHGTVANAPLTSTAPITRIENSVSSTDPTVALRYKPLHDLALRVSYGTGFLAPAANQLVPNQGVSALTVNDPRRGGASTTLQVGQFIGSGNPNLQPEESESWSAGLILTPRFAEGLRLSVDYTHIDKSDNIVSLGGQAIVNNEALLPSRVTRGPVSPGDPFGVGPIVFLDITVANIARAEVEAYDVAFDYRRDVGSIGTLEFYSIATWQTHYKTQILSTAPVEENVGVGTANPLKFKGNAGLTLSRENWAFGWTTRYFDSYLTSTNLTTIANQGAGGRVPSQIYHDVQASYRFGGGILAGTELQAGIRNVFDKQPPFDAGNTFGTFYSLYGDPRLSSYYVSLSKEFNAGAR